MKGFISLRMGLTHIREGYFTRFDRLNLFPTISILNHYVLSPLPALLNPGVITVSSLLVDIFDSPPTKPSVHPGNLDTGRCG